MAASAQLAIAKASFSAGLLRPDPAPCSTEEIEEFHALLASTTARCSRTNVQRCKQWVLQHLIQSPARTAALGKYFVALANSFEDGAPASEPQKPSAKRRRLHLLYILSDVLHHIRTRLKDDDGSAFAASLEPSLPALFRSAASFAKSPKQWGKLNDLISIWEQKKYLPSTGTLTKLREAVASGAESAAAFKANSANESTGQPLTHNHHLQATAKPNREPPFIMPSLHGDLSTPWYDLPAGNWLRVLEPNSTRPMNPSLIKPLQLAPGPADKSLVEAVKNLLSAVDRMYAKGSSSSAVGCGGDASLSSVAAAADDPSVDMDQMGQRVELDEITGEVLDGDTYYGWSRAFCDKMKARHRGRGPGRESDRESAGGRAGAAGRNSKGGGGSRSRSRSWSRRRRSIGGSSSRDGDGGSRSRGRRDRSRDGSRSGSSRPPTFKRRRMSPSGSRSRSRSRARSHNRGGYDVNNDDGCGDDRGDRGRDHQARGYSPSRSRSRSQGYRRRGSSRSPDSPREGFGGGGRSPSHSPGYSPPPASPPHHASGGGGDPNLPAPLLPPFNLPHPPPAALPPHFPFPVPPPPLPMMPHLPGFHNQWPVPPPPIPPPPFGNHHQHSHPPPPHIPQQGWFPPPPPPQQQQQQHHHQQGGPQQQPGAWPMNPWLGGPQQQQQQQQHPQPPPGQHGNFPPFDRGGVGNGSGVGNGGGWGGGFRGGGGGGGRGGARGSW